MCLLGSKDRSIIISCRQASMLRRLPCRRHLFAEKQYVEEFRTDDIMRELGLDQMALIRLGMLLGSDYTEGVAGIGIVNAVEVRRRPCPCHQPGSISAWHCMFICTPDLLCTACRG